MRILFLTHAFNSLTQRLYVELTRRGHEVSVELDINDQTSEEAVALYRPEVILAPYLRRAIPESIWRRHVCFVVHPGIVGDRGPSALDWAILEGEPGWGVTVLQATGEMDAGPVWASAEFPMRAGRKSSLYRNEVTEAAVAAVTLALERFASGAFRPAPPGPAARGRQRPPMRQADRAIDWQRDDTTAVLCKLDAADGHPGVLDTLLGERWYLYGGAREPVLRGTVPGEIVARRGGAILRATVDGAVWISHLRAHVDGGPALKLPATVALADRIAGIPASEAGALLAPRSAGYRDIAYEERDGVGYLSFDFYNGAMGSDDCVRLTAAYLEATRRSVRVLVLMGGADFWSNGIHLNLIEHAASAADESWRNINAMDDLARAIVTTRSQLTISALGGNAGAGGVFLALAADRVIARDGVILNPHYKGMGNLYGSEYWTYLLPKRVGWAQAHALTQNRLPLDARAAAVAGVVDETVPGTVAAFERAVGALAEALAARPDFDALLAAKLAARDHDEAVKPLEAYRAEELERMQLNFYGFDPSYHVARHRFVHKAPHAWTPRHLALHRRLGWRIPDGDGYAGDRRKAAA
jgi:putative two-component system protein, hydrogenase maturation factor HypX/HoxX